MRRWLAAHSKLAAIAAVGVVELAAFVLADPGELPDWLVTAAVVVQAVAVWAAPRNRQTVTRDDLARRVEYFSEPARERHTRRDRDDLPGPPRRQLKGDRPDHRGDDRPGRDVGP